MARLESTAVGGYFPTPDHLLIPISDLFDFQDSVKMLDPCAGDGSAIIQLSLLSGASNSALYTCELEKSRHKALIQNVHSKSTHYYAEDHHLQGDAFRIDIKSRAISFLYLNPPYDLDPVHGRLEQRFLERFEQALVLNGILCFVVPHYALKASAQTLGQHFDELKCFRFPGDDFAAYKQVVLVARRVDSRRLPDPAIVAQVMEWAQSVADCPALGDEAEKSYVPEGEYIPYGFFQMRQIDMAALLKKARVWRQKTRTGATVAVPHVLPDVPVENLLFRTYPLATPPRPAHIASGIAAGIFNGHRVTPKRSKLPDLLVKGVFDREYVTVEEKCNKKGEVTSVVQVQQPKLVTTVLDLTTKRYTTLATGPKTGSTNVEKMTIEDLLDHYGDGLMGVMRQQCPVLYDPKRGDAKTITMAPISRDLYQAQDHASRALVKLLGGNCERRERLHKAAILLGEIGSGKCLGLGTLVMKYDGSTIPVEQVRPGDLLMGPDSTPRRVLGTTRGTSPLYKIVPTVGDPWVCNDAHILTLVHTMSDDVIDLPVKDYVSKKRLTLTLSKGSRTTHPITEFKQFFPAGGVVFPPIADPTVDPYLLGVWYGDGTKDLNSFSITTKDTEIVSLLEETAATYCLKVRKSPAKNKCPTYSLSNGRTGRANPLISLMRVIYGDGKKLPKECLLGSRLVRMQFLAGLLDSDGHLSNGTYDFIQKRREWSDGVAFLARSLGFRATVSRAVKSAYRNGPGDVYWRVCLSGDFSQLPVRLSRKKAVERAVLRRNRIGEVSLRRTRQVNRTGIQVQDLGIGEYAGFELDGDGRFLLGDFTVTHNTSVALAVGRTISKRMLVMCPPHLLQTWMDETRTVIPEAEFRILENVSDVDAIQDIPADKMVIAVLSRETAKLGHGLDDVTGQCPKCGAALPEGQLAKRHATCDASVHRPKNALAHAGVALALKLINVLPGESRVSDMLPGRHLQKCVARFAKREEHTAWKGFDKAWIASTLEAAFERGIQSYDDPNMRLIARLLLADYAPLKVAQMIERFLAKEDVSYLEKEYARELSYLLPPKSEAQREAMDKTHRAESWGAPNRSLEGIEVGMSLRCGKVKWALGKLTLDDHEPGSVELAQSLIVVLGTLGSWTSSEVCGERLYQAAPRPRRYPLSRYITSRHPRLFDFLVLDEGHEYATDGSAQERSAHRLTSLGLPTILMTGSIMNGYAESLFSNMWALSEDFRAEFTREERQLFISRYGYRKRVLSEKDMKSGEVVAFGSHTDRVERSERVIGDAPGLLPIFLFRHLLRFSVTLHKADLALDLPPCRQIVERIQPEPELMASYLNLFDKLKRQIKADQFDEKLSGKLFGALAELPSYLDRSTLDTGNQKDGTYTIRYPESVGHGVVAVGEAHPAGRLSNKEQWVIAKVKAELAEGRNVMVFTWHVSLLPRLARIIQDAIGETVAVLNSDKVPTGKRQDWIDKNVVQKNRRVMVLNPVTVSTGLNNLVHFSTEIWHENPACNPNVVRQAIGRVDRIGAKKETRIFFPIYENTLQQALYDLLMKKVAVAISTDGLDPESALLAAGVSEDGYLSGLSIGKQLWAMIN